MSKLYTFDNIADIILFSLLTFFVAPYILVDKTKMLANFKDSYRTAFIVGVLGRLYIWETDTKKTIYPEEKVVEIVVTTDSAAK